MTEPRDYRPTVFLPKTDFPMKAGLPQKEPVILSRWQDEGIYQKVRESRKGREKFILHDGPPYANGDMHIGHALNHILKDMVCRTQNLLGKDAPYVPGWDCHGLPIEWKVEEEYRKKKKNKDEVPPKEFRAECRAYAQKWVDVQREQLKRLGINGDWDNPYLTMDSQAEGTIVRELLKFAESGQLYRGAKPVMWSPVEKTALAEAEVEYEDIVSTQIDVAFEIVESPNCPQMAELLAKGWKVSAVIWTTTPWTIPVNQALAYGPDTKYRLLFEGGARVAWLVAEDLFEPFYERLNKPPAAYPIASAYCEPDDDYPGFLGSELAGTICQHPMANLFRRPVLDTGLGSSSNAAPEGQSQAPDQVRGDGGVDVNSPLAEFFLRPRPMLPGDFVTTESGTGLVHMAPDHGEDDFALCKAHGIEPVFAVLGDGKYREDWGWLGGQGSVINPKFNAPDGPICSDLREAGGLLAASADYKHSYPHSWRSKAKVIYRCTPQWFVPMDRELPFRLREGSGEGLLSSTGEGTSPPLTPPACGRGTLRDVALAAIADTRFVPEKGRNRIGAMVEGRPDWVLSRQRAWGVPITLFVDRKTGQYLNDPQVNARIVAAVMAGGVDAWDEEHAQEYLGEKYKLDDYERVTDILDVWFDSGSTHAFVLESGRWPDLQWPANLYLEGSDQHRGWFQSSLLESCATRGRAPYDAVLTHGFTMDQKGMKMSKSLGNTISPIDLMRDYGADILRLWALSVDFTEDHRIGKEILQGVADQYRKLRNTYRYLLGALEGFSEEERLPVAEMPELEQYMLGLLGKLDATLRQAVDDFDYNTYVRALTDFCNEDLSAFFFDIRKDSLYCDAPTDLKRRAYRTVLDTLFHALVRYGAPVLVFTAEEVWASRYPGADSVHLLEWPDVQGVYAEIGGSFYPADGRINALIGEWDALRRIRNAVLAEIEPKRREKVLGSSLQAVVTIPAAFAIREIELLTELFIVAKVNVSDKLDVSISTDHKCGRCWRLLPEVTEDGELCARCDDVVAAIDAEAVV